jgi:low temperature requirement protein LtrA
LLLDVPSLMERTVRTMSDGSATVSPRGGGRPWRVPMVARDTGERHRASTPLELLFDLTFVVAVAAAAAQLAHAIVEDHAAQGLLGYLMVFFAIWWAWMNFTWFASAHDRDDTPYRLVTLVQMSGVLVLAAGVPAAMNE